MINFTHCKLQARRSQLTSPRSDRLYQWHLGLWLANYVFKHHATRNTRSQNPLGEHIMSWNVDFCIFTSGYFLPKFRLPREYRISGYIFNFLSKLAWSRLDLWETAGFMWLFSWLLPKVSHLKVFVAQDQLLSTSAAPWKSWKCDRFADKRVLCLMCILFFCNDKNRSS